MMALRTSWLLPGICVAALLGCFCISALPAAPFGSRLNAQRSGDTKKGDQSEDFRGSRLLLSFSSSDRGGRIDSTTYGENIPLELFPDSALLGLRGRSILTFGLDYRVSTFGLGLQTEGGTRVFLRYGAGRVKPGTFRDQDLHHPAPRRAPNGTVYRDSTDLSEVLWSDVYAQFDGMHDVWELEVSQAPSRNGLSFLFGVIAYSQRFRFSIKSPFVSVREFSEWSTTVTAAKNLNFNARRDGLDLQMRINLRYADFIDLYLTGRAGGGVNKLTRDWANRQLVVSTETVGYTLAGKAGLGLTAFGSHVVAIEYGGEKHLAKKKNSDQIGGVAYGSRGEILEDRINYRLDVRYTLHLGL